MTSLPIKASSFASVIREVVKVRTKGSLAGVNLLMIALVFPVVFLFGSSITLYQAVVIVALFICWQAFAIYALRQLPSHDTTQDNKTIASKTETTSPESKKGRIG